MRRARKSLSWLLACKRVRQNGADALSATPRPQATGHAGRTSRAVLTKPTQRRNGWSKQNADRQRYWDELRVSDPKRIDRESKSLILQTKGDDPLAQMARDAARKLKRENPEEYTRRALEALKPRKVTQDVVVWRVSTDAGTVLMWPNGREVRHGGDVQHAEIIKDARLGWVLNPSPMGAEIEDTASPVKKELIQDPMDCDAEGYPKWKWVPEGSTGIHEQQPDGSFKRTDNASPWGKATPIVFKDAEPPASPEHTVFKYGGWWTPAQVAAATSAEWSDTPPAVLPPLQRVVADSVAVEPPPNAAQLERMNRPAETVWERTMRERRQQAEREAALASRNVCLEFDRDAAPESSE